MAAQPPPHRTNSDPLFVNRRVPGPAAPRTTAPAASTSSFSALPGPPVSGTVRPPQPRTSSSSSTYLPPPPPAGTAPPSRLAALRSAAPSTPDATIDIILRRFTKLYSTLSLHHHPGEIVIPSAIDPDHRKAYLEAEKKRSDARAKQVDEGYASISRGLAKLLRELVSELPTPGNEVVGLKAAVERLGEENRALKEEKDALERTVGDIKRGQEAMANEFRKAQTMAESGLEARLAALERRQEPATDPRRRPSGSPAPLAVVPPPPPQVTETEERLVQLVGEMEKVEKALREVGRKRKAEGGTLWEEVERIEKKMDGAEERDHDRALKEQEREQRASEKDVERTDAVDPIAGIKDRLATIENEIRTLPPPRAPAPEAEKKEAVASIVDLKDRLAIFENEIKALPSPRATTPEAEKQEAAASIDNIKVRLAAVENEIKTLPPPRPATPTPSPDSPQHPARLRESFQVLLSSIDSVKAHLNEVSAAAATSNAVRDTEMVAVDIKILSLRDAVKQLITEVGDGKSSTAALEKRFEAIAKDVHNATAAASCVKTLNPFLLETLPEMVDVCREFRAQGAAELVRIEDRGGEPVANGVHEGGQVGGQGVPMAGVVGGTE